MKSAQFFLARFGIDRSSAILFGLALALLAAAWIIRETSVHFNRVALWIGTGTLILNSALILGTRHRSRAAQYLFAGTSVIIELLLVVLLIVAGFVRH